MPSVTTSRRVSRGELPLEADVPADLPADRPAAFVGDASRHGARGDAPRLQQQHAAAIDQRRRHARRLAGARRGDQHGGAMAIERVCECSSRYESTGRTAARSIIKAYRQGYPPSPRIHAATARLRNTLEPDPVQTGGGRAEMSKSTPVPTANTFAEAFPNSTKVRRTVVDTPTDASSCACRSRGRRLAAASRRSASTTPAVRKATIPRHGLPKLREPWIAPRRADAKARQAVTQLHYARKGEITPEMAVHRDARRPAGRFRARRSRARPRHHSRQHQSPRARADDHRPQLPGEDQRQHRQLRRLLVDRRGSREAALVDAVGRRHGDGSVDRQEHPRDARVDPAQLAGADRHRADLPGAREGRRPSGRSDVGDLSRHARSSRRSRASTTSPCMPACCCATSR